MANKALKHCQICKGFWCFFSDDNHIIRDSYGLGGMTRYDRAYSMSDCTCIIGGLVLVCRPNPSACPPWLYSTQRLWHHRGESSELANAYSRLRLPPSLVQGSPHPKINSSRFALSLASLETRQRSYGQIKTKPKSNKKSNFFPTRPPWL